MSTFTSSATAYSTTGMTQLMPTFGFAGQINQVVIDASARTITYTTANMVSGAGSPLPGIGSYAVLGSWNNSTVLPYGTKVTAVTSTGTGAILSIDKTPTISGTYDSFRYTHPAINYDRGTPISNSGLCVLSTVSYIGANNGTLDHILYSPIIEFMTDSAKIVFQVAGTSNSGTQNTPILRLAVDGVYENLEGTGITNLTHHQIVFADSRPRRIRIEPYSGSNHISSMHINTTSKIWAIPNKFGKVLSIGNSWQDNSAGDSGGSIPFMRAAYALNLNIQAAGIGGTGYFATSGGIRERFSGPGRLAHSTVNDWDAIWFFGSVNELNNASLASNPRDAWAAYRALHPNTPFFIFGVPATVTADISSFTTHEATLKAQFDLWNDPNSYWIPCSARQDPWIDGNNSGVGAALFHTDNVHLLAKGNRYIGNRMLEEIVSIAMNF